VFKPVNRYICISPPEVRPDTSSGILLPEDFKPTEARHGVSNVVSWSEEVRFAEQLQVGIRVLVDKSMIEEVEIDGHKYHLILDNYILGLITEQ